MVTTFNFHKYSPSPATEQAIAQFKQNVGWDSLSPVQQESIRRTVTEEVSAEIHERIREMRSQIGETLKTSLPGEKKGLVHISDHLRQLDLVDCALSTGHTFRG